MDARVIEQAVREIAIELRSTERQFDQLKKHKDELDAAMASMSALLRGIAPLPLGPRTQSEDHLESLLRESVSKPAQDEDKPTWMLVRDLFEKVGGTLTVPDIHRLINQDGVVVSNPDAIRIAMRRKPDIFSNVSGRFSLIEAALHRQSPGGFQFDSNGAEEDFSAEEATEVAS